MGSSILKQFSFTEKSYLQLRFEFFNVLNHPNFAAPASLSATSAAFERLRRWRTGEDDPDRRAVRVLVMR